jgi:type III secretion system HrpB2-like protein
MTDPITAVTSVESTVVSAAKKPMHSPAELDVGKKFEEAMRKPDAHLLEAQQNNNDPKALAKMLDGLDHTVKQTFADVDNLTARLHELPLKEQMAAFMQMSQKLTMASLQLTMASSTAQSANKGLQTLLKNQ